jgi:hypothetical protein
MNQNSFAPTDSGVAAFALGNMIRLMYAPALVDDMVFWTPMGAAAAQQYLSPGPQHKIRPISRPGDFDPFKKREQRHATHVRRVLHTGNAVEWFVVWPWTFETTDEYVRGAQELAAAVATAPDAELVIRAKFRPEADGDALRKLLPINERCLLRGNADSTRFAQDLEAADLVTCLYSTTIIQALYHRKPVLLWGGHRRYRHLPARTTPPTATDRAAVYAVDDPKNLGVMIAAILDAHAGRPLTDAELADFTWPTNPPGMPELAQALAARDHRQTWATKKAS